MRWRESATRSVSSPRCGSSESPPVEHAFPDHHRFEAADLAFGDALPIVMTEKDAVKCAAFATDRMWYLRVAVQFERDDAARLLQWLGGRLARKLLMLDSRLLEILACPLCKSALRLHARGAACWCAARTAWLSRCAMACR